MRKIVLIVVGLVSLFLCGTTFAQDSGEGPAGPESMGEMNPNDEMGGHGNISVTANVLPKKMAELCRLSLAGKTEEAEALNAELKAMHEVMFLESNPIPVKWALHQMGRMTAGIRLPLTPLAEQYRNNLQEVLTSFGLVK